MGKTRRQDAFDLGAASIGNSSSRVVSSANARRSSVEMRGTTAPCSKRLIAC